MTLKDQIIQLKSKGLKQFEIAKQLGCSPTTVCHHLDPDSYKKIKERRKNYKKIKPINKLNKKNIDIEIKNVCWKYAEAICNARLVELGYETFIPSVTGGEIDLIAYKDKQAIKVQIKSVSPTNSEAFTLKLVRNSINYHKAVRSDYTNIDWFLIYDGNNIYKVLFEDVKRSISLRYKAPKNNYTTGVRMAKDYIF